MLNELFGSRSAEMVFYYMLIYRKGYARKVSAVLGFSLNTIQKQFKKFESAGIFVSFLEGKTRIFEWNPRYPFKKELQDLLNKAYEYLPESEKQKYFKSVHAQEDQENKMNEITPKLKLIDVALVVCTCLKNEGIDALLTGGGAVSIYTENKYQSDDLDFITVSPRKEIAKALSKIGFKETKSRYFVHDSTDFIVEFPSGPLSVGNKPIFEFNEIKKDSGYLKLLTPTHCVMDRLAAYYYWDDPQSLDQAILVALNHPINLDEIHTWSEEEGMTEKFKTFKKKIQNP